MALGFEGLQRDEQISSLQLKSMCELEAAYVMCVSFKYFSDEIGVATVVVIKSICNVACLFYM